MLIFVSLFRFNVVCSQFQSLLYLLHIIQQVLDEADRLLNEDFEKSLNQILEEIPRERKTFLFSATMTKKVGTFLDSVVVLIDQTVSL